MTMPSLIANHKKQVIISKLNKFYTVISNAYIMAKNDNGDISGWNLVNYQSSTNDEEDILYYLLPYMNVVKSCGKKQSGCFPDVSYSSLGSYAFGLNFNTMQWYSNAVLNDGLLLSSITFKSDCTNTWASCGILRVDVNGFAGPNQMGVDLFSFYVYADKIIPAGVKLVGMSSDNNMVNRGDYCTALVIYGRNMDYIKDKKCELWE